VPALAVTTERLRKHHEPVDEDRELTLSGRADAAGRANDVAEIDIPQELAALRLRIRVHDELDVTRAVAQHQEDELADIAFEHHPAGDDPAIVGQRVGPERNMRVADARGRVGLADAERLLEVQCEGAVAESLPALAARLQDLALAAGRLLSHRRRGRRCGRTPGAALRA